MTVLSKPNWNRAYDVIVVGFGGAGATAARFAADNGASVLLTDVAPLGHEGGNTRYAGQGMSVNIDPAEALKYYKSLYPGYDMNEKVLRALVSNQKTMPDYLKRYLDVNPVSTLDVMEQHPELPRLVPEYPGRPGYKAMDALTVHAGTFDAALWKILREKVLARKDMIDIWLESPVKHLIQQPDSDNTITGVEIQRHGQKVLVKANKGVVLTIGGFENNKQMIQSFLGAPALKPLGTLYNRGDGIKMATEIGAKLWHMSDYEALGFSGFSVNHTDQKRGHLIMKWPAVSQGSIFIAADDGGRFLREDEENKHGHLKDHDTYSIPTPQLHPHLIFDQQKYDELKAESMPEPGFFDLLIKADTLDELAKKIKASSEVLQQTVTDFNRFSKDGRDIQFGRNTTTMRAFGAGPYYAAPLVNTMLNTQGGPEKNEKGQVLDWDNQPIHHLYEAGEFGGLTGRLYNGATNLSECLIFGKIAGENVVKESSLATTDATTSPSQKSDNLGKNDILDAETSTVISVGPHQYIGTSNLGMGGTVSARITYQKGQLEKVELPGNHETEGIGSRAVRELPDQMVKNNTYAVDAISGATTSSNAIKQAVKNALDQVDAE